MKSMIKNAAFLTFVLILISMTACKKEDPTGDFTMDFDFMFGMNDPTWELNKQYTHPKTKDSLTFTTMKFYVSNIKLEKADGTWWEEEESYHIVDEATGATLTLNNVPVGEYTALQYTLGVDSTRNTSGAQTGALAPSEGMYWNWNSGYIMIKAEGTSPNSSDGTFAFHLGGFSGDFNIVTQKSTDFNGNILTITEDAASVAKFLANPAKLWHSVSGLATTHKIMMPNATATTMANDFYSGIAFTGLE